MVFDATDFAGRRACGCATWLSLAFWLAVSISLLHAPLLACGDAGSPGGQGDVAASAQLPAEGTGLARRIEQRLDGWTGAANAVLTRVIFAPIAGVPFIVLWLIVAAVVCTAWMRFINLRAFRHAIAVVRGRYDSHADAGEVTHRQALSSALSGTVGLGNIAGVAIAVSVGGPGATFWMIVAGLLDMTLKFTECTLGQLHRKIDSNGSVSGGPMHYLSEGLDELGLPRVGKVLAGAFLVLCVGCSLAAGNMFQVNQSLNAVAETFSFLDDARWAYGLLMALAVGSVVIGGVRRIAATTETLVPLMCGIYMLGALTVVLLNLGAVPGALATIVRGAFTDNAAYGGFLGVVVQGFRRAAFSSEAGAGSASIAHSAARTDEPVREGIVALLEPFVDTVIVCTMTSLVIVITGAYHNPDPAFAAAIQAQEGARLTSLAFSQELAWFPYVLSVVVILFAFSTIITWSYYGERCVRHLFGWRASMPYRWLCLLFVFIGSQVTARNVKDFADMMLLSMTLPNILGLYLLAPKVRSALDDYWTRYRSGSFVPRPAATRPGGLEE